MGMKTYSKAQERRILVDNTSLLRKQTTTSHKYFVAEPRKYRAKKWAKFIGLKLG